MYYYVHSLTIFLISYYLPRSPNFYKVCITAFFFLFYSLFFGGVIDFVCINKIVDKIKKSVKLWAQNLLLFNFKIIFYGCIYYLFNLCGSGVRG